MMMTIQTNPKGSRSIDVSDEHIATLQKYALLNDLLDSNGIVDESVLQKLRLNVRGLLEHHSDDAALLSLCREVIFHDNMKAFGLHQLILAYLQETNRADETEEKTEEGGTNE